MSRLLRRVLIVVMLAGIALIGGPAPAAPPEAPASMAALGDSITRGYNACGWLFDCVNRSWSTGGSELIESHRLRLSERQPDLADQVYNNARSGATSPDLTAQARLAVDQRAEYVTVLIGAGDICQGGESDMTPVADFARNITDAFDTLAEGTAPMVFVASVPDLVRLWEIGHDSVDVRNTWNLAEICPAALERPDSTEPTDQERRERVGQRIDAYNEQLATACERYAGACRYDGGAVHEFAFTMQHISAWDFFHPNRYGQSELASITWAALLD